MHPVVVLVVIFDAFIMAAAVKYYGKMHYHVNSNLIQLIKEKRRKSKNNNTLNHKIFNNSVKDTVSVTEAKL